MTETDRLPSYLEAFNRGLSDRDRVRLFLLDMINKPWIPEAIDTGFFGFTVSKATIRQKLLEWIVNNGTDEQISEICKDGRRRFG